MKLAYLLKPWVNQPIADCEITALYHDSRQVKPGGLFLAYPGTLTDGRSYIEQAYQAGAVAIAYEQTSQGGKHKPRTSPHQPLIRPLGTFSPFPAIREIEDGLREPTDDTLDTLLSIPIPCLPVPNLSRLLAPIASRFYQNPTQSLSITGVTGTNGKTTIAYQLTQAHALLGQSARYIGTLGQGSPSQIKPLLNTTPDALCLQGLCHAYLEQGVQEVCLEVSSHALCEGRVDEVNFQQAIYTNLTQDHLDYHGNMQAYAEAKARLFAYPSLSCAIFNQDDAYVKQMISACSPSCQIVTYALHAPADVQAMNCQYSLLGSEFDVLSPWGKYHLNIQGVGEFNIYNSLAVFASLMTHGYAADDVVSVMAQVVASPGRMELVRKEPCVLIDYAHTPDALKNALSTLKELRSKRNKQGQIWVVFGCGGDRDRGKRPLMGQIASQWADKIILTSDNPRNESPEQILSEIAEGIPSGHPTKIIEDRKEAIHQVLKLADKDDIVLIAGKGHESYQQIGHQRHAFSDQEIVKQFLV